MDLFLFFLSKVVAGLLMGGSTALFLGGITRHMDRKKRNPLLIVVGIPLSLAMYWLAEFIANTLF